MIKRDLPPPAPAPMAEALFQAWHTVTEVMGLWSPLPGLTHGVDSMPRKARQEDQGYCSCQSSASKQESHSLLSIVLAQRFPLGG